MKTLLGQLNPSIDAVHKPAGVPPCTRLKLRQPDNYIRSVDYLWISRNYPCFVALDESISDAQLTNVSCGFGLHHSSIPFLSKLLLINNFRVPLRIELSERTSAGLIHPEIRLAIFDSIHSLRGISASMFSPKRDYVFTRFYLGLFRIFGLGFLKCHLCKDLVYQSLCRT